ncbi:Crp/Fnr family transcriptional regulator [Nocardia sp. alder85J]|uniref:Crp/Fnr family transcriptional regulator n=1 Tax=Nocardia sp. alder85J TaxID=2862949 RepID=UPI001CD2D2DB|nr:Crp/Fnr family transcriptional regulator [Nocardia sp. alder85J]MCX4095520.1 Crp/Fnr family transcriptional regulator [Nocardia sp. alder85J]
MLGGLTKSAREQLLTLGVRARYPGERTLIREQEDTTFVFVLLDGVVKATGRARDGRDVLLAVRMGGDLVGEFAAIDEQPRSATVVTCGPVVARLITRAEFLACLQRNSQIALAVNESIVAKLRVANERRIDFTGCDVPTRLARVLHQIAMTYGEPAGEGAVIRWPITQPELATLSGAAEPSVHKALRRLRESGVISTGYRTIRVEDLELLSNIAFSE